MVNHIILMVIDVVYSTRGQRSWHSFTSNLVRLPEKNLEVYNFLQGRAFYGMCDIILVHRTSVAQEECCSRLSI